MPHPKYDIKVDSTVPAEQTAFITNTGTHTQETDFMKLSLKKIDKPNEQDGTRDSGKTKHKQSKREREREGCPE